jgi:hypothetical protein
MAPHPCSPGLCFAIPEIATAISNHIQLKGAPMEMQPKLLAAADMCEAGEEVNLDELAFLLRYAADELGSRPRAADERDRLLDQLRRRLLARCDLLNRPETDHQKAREGTLAELEELEARLDHDLRNRFETRTASSSPEEPNLAPPAPDIAHRFVSGR